MRHLFLGGMILMLVMSAAPARAERTEVRYRRGEPAVHVDGQRIWYGERGERVISRVVRSRRGDAIAFATRSAAGVSLVVVLVDGEVRGHVMRWPVPARAKAPQRPGAATVTWLGRQRVAYGASELSPAVVASWQLRR